MKRISFVLDVDGVITTGQFLYSVNGKEYKVFGPHDTDGLKLIRDKLRIKFITADKRGFPIVKRRIVDDMGYELELVKEEDRYEYVKKHFDLSSLIYMGDGYYDARLIKECFFGIAPNSARIEAKEAADFVTPSNAAEGAVLDACLEVLKRFFPRDLESE